MRRCVLWWGLALLGALQAQAEPRPPQNRIPAPSLLRIPLQPDFEDDQFQGKWYVVGLAGNNVDRNAEKQTKMYATVYDLVDDGSYNVTSILQRGKHCDFWGRTFVPSFQPGQFNLGNIQNYPKLLSYTVRVVSTDYTQTAMVFFKKVGRDHREHFKVTLYGRDKLLRPEQREKFILFAKSLGLRDDNIVFPVPIDRCIDK
ncbi:neutrophil gelatinase-associated lipocalin [Sorex araneus]|uniref:neutrophil gelatinase-associated lipocalin n=1 Tax=Sorex araneus TaxID=42254 RepID=UPI0003316880|nr:neutrophil gelatinase-associated lipocalin [Sorex araneus]XP_054980723.1 neutrophil gelatinase-associated lipocalin [Sorex araneus]